MKFVSRVRQAKFDFVIDLHSYYETNLLGFLSGAPHRLYSRRSNRSLDFLANFKPQPAKEVESTHLIDRYLNLLKPLGIQNPPRVPTLNTNASRRFRSRGVAEEREGAIRRTARRSVSGSRSPGPDLACRAALQIWRIIWLEMIEFASSFLLVRKKGRRFQRCARCFHGRPSSSTA